MIESNPTEITLGSDNIFEDLGFKSEEATNLNILSPSELKDCYIPFCYFPKI